MKFSFVKLEQIVAGSWGIKMLLSSYLTEDMNSAVGLCVCLLRKLRKSPGKFGGEGWGAICTLIPQ